MNRNRIHLPRNAGDKIADSVTAFFGTWLCLGLHTLWFVLWFVFSLDVALLTNIVSLEAIGLAILIMMSQGRAADKDRARDDVEAQEVDELYQINKQQLLELEKLSSIETLLTQLAGNGRKRSGTASAKTSDTQQ